jgi:hypothetical protein
MRLQLAGTTPSRLPCPVARIEERALYGEWMEIQLLA